MNAYSAVIDAWVNTLKAAGHTEESVYLRRRHVIRVLTQIGIPLHDLTTEDIINWTAAQEWKASTRRTYRVSLGLFFAWIHKTGQGEDIGHDLPTVSVPRALPRPAEDACILDAMKTAPKEVCLMMELMAYGGLRRGEVSRVHSRDLTGEWLEVTGKGGHIRLVPLPGHVCKKIRAAKNWVFPGQINGHLSPSYVGKRVSRYLPDGITGHMLRHRFATVTYQRSKDIRSVQELLGHAKLDTTMIYTKIDDVTRKTAASRAWGLTAAA